MMAAFASFSPEIPWIRVPFTRPNRFHQRTLCQLAVRASTHEIDFSPVRPSTQQSLFGRFTESLTEILNPPPDPVVLARRTLDQDLAVMLMRSGYNSVDQLDFVAMDEFQARFFEIRSCEWETFITKNFGMRQGVITDPRYFDFISYAQMLTIQYFMREPRAIFEERYGNEDGSWGTRLVRRDTESMPMPTDIFTAWRMEVGRKVYGKILDTANRPQPVLSGNKRAVLEGITRMYNYLELHGFCLKTNIVEDGDDYTITVEMVAPCILWGSKALKRRKSVPNDYDCFAVQAFCEASNTTVSVSTLYSENSITRVWSI